ncbi:hypothetical protein BgiBS90_025372, partial [Biomphalaria glabrata]
MLARDRATSHYSTTSFCKAFTGARLSFPSLRFVHSYKPPKEFLQLQETKNSYK